MLGWREGIEVCTGMASPDGPLLGPREWRTSYPTPSPITLLLLLLLLLMLIVVVVLR